MSTIIAVVVLLVAAFLVIAARRPDAFRIERTASIKAPPQKIFPLIADFHNWAAWSPFENLDPAMTKTFTGSASGKGAIYAWEGNSKAGKGRMEITDTSLPSKIVIKLDFYKPFEAHNTAEYTLDARGDSTDVTWAMYGRSPFAAKVMGLVFNMDKTLGKQFDTGLANLKAVAER
jgi:uncharacterized protein YndB with AHSA1/START domain